MDRADFESLVERMERISAERPDAYRRRVYGLAALGYGYLLFVIVVLLASCGLAIWSVLFLKILGVKLALVTGALLVAVLRALWVKQSPPSGERMTPADVPALFALLEDLRGRLQTPPIHAVLITPDFNAAVSQVPRLGLLGWHRNYLLIGLPLMKALTVEQFKAVVGHELGHLSRGHARAANWIYRLRMIWARLEATFEQRPRWGSGAIRRFFKWYIPYFNAVSFPFARANEYEADASSVKLTSARHVAQALTNVQIIGSYLTQQYWPAIHEGAKDSAEPSCTPYSGFVAHSISQVAPSDLEKWRDAGLKTPTSHADTHPSLSDRLKAIGAPAEFAPPLEGEGADQLLGAERSRLAAALDAQWRARIAGSWQQFHAETRSRRARLDALHAKTTQGPLDEAESLELAALEEAVGMGPTAVLPLVRDTLHRFPNSTPASFALARLLMRSGEEEGAQLMLRVVSDDRKTLLAGSELLRSYYAQRGDFSNAKLWRDRHVDAAIQAQGTQKARRQLLLSDTYAHHGLSAEVASTLSAKLESIPGVRRAYLVRRTDAKFGDVPTYVLGVKSTGFFSLHSEKRAAVVIQAVKLGVVFPGDTVIVNVDGPRYKFGRKMRRVGGARLV